MVQDNEKPCWQQLMHAWREEGNDALTLPFLIGAADPDAKHDASEMIELLMSIAENGVHEVYTTICMNLGELVFGLRKGKENIHGRFLPFKDGEVSKLFIGSFADETNLTVEMFVQCVAERYAGCVEAGKYSFRDGEWKEFSGAELAFIKRSCVCFLS
jgi:hypothetical protein